MGKYHEPVLTQEIIGVLQVKKDGKYIDVTLGDGGHTLEILRLGGKVLGLDLDEGSLERASHRIAQEELQQNFLGVQGNFSNIENLAKENGFSEVNGIIFDLGYSSSQLEDQEIGLSFSKDQPLDMRLDKTLGVTAEDLLKALSEKELAQIFREFGEEHQAKKFAKVIVENRNLRRLKTTKDLADLLASASPGYEARIHPATRVFQALRIAVNSELDSLKTSLPRAARLLLPGGRMAVISFHSLEDRIVKQFTSGVQSDLRPLDKAPITPSQEEVSQNPRARSAKLRVIEKIK